MGEGLTPTPPWQLNVFKPGFIFKNGRLAQYLSLDFHIPYALKKKKKKKKIKYCMIQIANRTDSDFDVSLQPLWHIWSDSCKAGTYHAASKQDPQLLPCMHDLLQTLHGIPLTPGEEPPVCCRMWWTFNIFYLIVQILLKQERTILHLNHYMFYFKKIQWKRFLTIWKQYVFLEEFKFSDFLVFCFLRGGYICVLTTF